jgi:putative two-component system response regulator
MTAHPSMRSSSCERILLVEDNPSGRRARQVVLEEVGYEVVAVCCGADAMERFGKEQFDAVVTDYKMPHLDGIELIARMRERSPRTPIILISGIAEVLGLDESNTGADVVIQKNCYEVAALTRAVARLLTSRKPVRRQGARHEVATRRLWV